MGASDEKDGSSRIPRMIWLHGPPSQFSLHCVQPPSRQCYVAAFATHTVTGRSKQHGRELRTMMDLRHLFSVFGVFSEVSFPKNLPNRTFEGFGHCSYPMPTFQLNRVAGRHEIVPAESGCLADRS